MLPIDIDMNKFMTFAKKASDNLEKENKKNQISCSQQALANVLVAQSMASNPNVQPMEQKTVNNN